MSNKNILLFIIIVFFILLFTAYDSYVTEETFADVLDAKVNSKYVHDQNNDVRQVTFDVDVPLNRYFVNKIQGNS